MKQKDFVAIAGAIKDAKAALSPLSASEVRILESMTKDIAKVCAKQNPRFDLGRFLACAGTVPA